MKFSRKVSSKESANILTDRAGQTSSNDSRDIAKVVKVAEEYKEHISKKALVKQEEKLKVNIGDLLKPATKPDEMQPVTRNNNNKLLRPYNSVKSTP